MNTLIILYFICALITFIIYLDKKRPSWDDAFICLIVGIIWPYALFDHIQKNLW